MWRERDVFYNLGRGSEARGAQIGRALELAQASRSVVITPEGLLHRLHTDQNGSISPTMLLATLPPAVALMLFIGIACGQSTSGNPTPTPTEIARTQTPVLPAPIIEVRPTSSPTPEPEFKFGEYDVFVGEGVVFTALPNGRLLFQAAKPEVTCDNPKYALYKFLVAPPYTPGGFNYSARVSIEGTLISATTVAGQMSNKEHFVNTSDGRIKCSANSFPITAQRAGKGQEAFLKAYKTAMKYPDTTSLAEIKVIINRAIALYGFELP